MRVAACVGGTEEVRNRELDSEGQWGKGRTREGRTLETRKVPRALMLFMRSYVLTEVLVESVSEIAEALLMTISIPPNCSAVFSIAWS